MLHSIADRIDADTCELSEDQVMDIASVIGHQLMSKDDACTHLNVSRSKFDNLVREGKLPKGRKRKGFKELVYYKDELDKSAKLLRGML